MIVTALNIKINHLNMLQQYNHALKYGVIQLQAKLINNY